MIIGLGEIGLAIQHILQAQFDDVYGYDPKDIRSTNPPYDKYNVLHICFPPSDKFIEQVKAYQEKFLLEDGLTIIHSTVQVGTCDQLNAVASPVRGIHPNLVPGIRTFIKYFGGKDAYRASKIFEACQIPTRCYPNARDIESCKLWDTTRFGWDILINKIIYKWCEENHVNFEIVWKEWNETYNTGYYRLGKEKFIRPTFEYVPGPIGGHCVMQNCELLDNIITKTLKEFNNV